MKKLIVLLGLAGFIVTADNLVVSPILPSISQSMSVSISRAGLLISAYMIPFGMFQIIFGMLADRFGKKQVIRVSITLFTIATGLCAFGYRLEHLIIFRGITGVFAASVVPISIALIGDMVPVQERQTAIGSFLGICFLGQGFSMVIGGTIAYLVNWRGVFVIYAFLALVPTILLLVNYPLLPGDQQRHPNPVANYIKLLSSPKSAGTYLLILLEGFFIMGSYSYIGSFLSKTYHINNFLIGCIMTCFGIMTITGGRINGKLAVRFGSRRVLSSGLAVAATADGVISIWGRHLPVMVISVAALGFGFILAHSTLLGRATEFSPTARGTAMSLVSFFFMGGGGIGTALAGRIVSASGLDQLYLIYGSALAFTLLLSFLPNLYEFFKTAAYAKVRKRREENSYEQGKPCPGGKRPPGKQFAADPAAKGGECQSQCQESPEHKAF